MTERVVNTYQRLFDVRVLHHYWLDEGGKMFDLIAVKGLGCVYRNTSLGFTVAAPSGATIPDDATFEFVLIVTSAAFLNYTALTLRPQMIYTLFHQSENKTYRYKANVPVLSNLTGATRGTGPNKALYLSAEIPAIAVDDSVEAIVLSGAALMQLTSDQPGASTQRLAPTQQASDLPVFVHQGDAPVIVPPAGLAGAPARGIALSAELPDAAFALVRLSSIRSGDDDFSFINAGGHAKTPAPVFHIRFKNRATIWQYRNKRTGANTTAEPNPLPLTYFGNAGTKRKPSEGLVKAVTSGTRITQLVSEIFE
jgi:hypothetical protein